MLNILTFIEFLVWRTVRVLKGKQETGKGEVKKEIRRKLLGLDCHRKNHCLP